MSEASTPAAASVAEASEDPLRAPSAEDDAPLVMPAFRSLVALYTISFVSQMDGAVMLPTLWPFVEELCGREGCQSHYVYGWAQASFFGTRVVAMFLLGQALDRGASFRGAMQCCLWLATAGGLLYFWAPVLSRARGLGAPTVVAARALLGAGSAASVASFAFIATFVPKPRRTGLFATTIGLQRASTPLAPILVLALSEIPARWGRGAVPVTESDAAGLVVALFNCVAGCVVATYFIEPRRRRRGGPPAKPPSAAAVLRALRRTGAWASFFFSFQNNWNNQAVLWTMPLITSKLYGADPVRDSLLFASGGCVGVLTAVAISSRFFQGRKIRDRTMIVASQCGVGCVLLAMSAFFGCPSLSGRGGAPLWLLWVLFSVYYVPFIGQMPSNNSVYSKLISAAAGPHQGVYQSLLEISKSLARAGAGLTIGVAYSTAGPCVLWAATLGIWAAQFLPLLLVWERYGAADAAPRPLARSLLSDFQSSREEGAPSPLRLT